MSYLLQFNHEAAVVAIAGGRIPRRRFERARGNRIIRVYFSDVWDEPMSF